MRKFLFILLACISLQPFSGLGQDAHFSQFYGTPLQLNPAYTGVFDGKFRISNNYRSQWSGFGKGYRTIHVSLDGPIAKGMLGNNYFGAGLLVYQDKAGETGLTSTIIEASLSYVTALDDIGDHFLSIGFQTGLNQQSLDLSKATWDSQWNGDTFDPALPSFESIQLHQFAYLDFNAGLLYYYVPDGNNSLAIGGGYSHIGSPNISFFTEADAPLRSRYTFTASGEIGLDAEKSSWIDPKLLVNLQGKQKEIVFGGYVKNKVQFKSRYTNYKKEAYFYLGGFYRWNDAVIASARVEYNSFGLGLSYDFNVSQLSTLAGSASAFEINLSFVSYVKRGQKAKNFNKMPRFF
ncbi:MAG: PorP/SprF family type IX secretion system membrane protein [Bacteroidia bacterium]|nr:PorP/SprF family type IX secretion system membrane protein [Bacteroidia bacterium]